MKRIFFLNLLFCLIPSFAWIDPNSIRDSVDPFDVRWSPDGELIAFAADNPESNFDLWVVRSDGSGAWRLTSDQYNDWSPCWSRDGNKLFFLSDRDSSSGIWVINRDGTGLEKYLTTEFYIGEISLSHSGQYFAARVEVHSEPQYDAPWAYDSDIWIIDASSGEVIYKFGFPGVSERSPSWSPDDTEIAFSDGYALWKINLLTMERKKLTTPDIDDFLLPPGKRGIIWDLSWSPDGEKIAFDVSSSSSEITGFESGIYAYNLSDGNIHLLTSAGSVGGIDWSPDGSKIVFVPDFDVTNPDVEDPQVTIANSDGTGLQRLTYIHLSDLEGQAKAPSVKQRKSLVCKSKDKPLSLTKEKKEEKGNKKEAIQGRSIPRPSASSLPAEKREKVRYFPVGVSVFSLSVLGYALWKFLKILS